MRLYIIHRADPDYSNNTITEYEYQEAKALATRLAKKLGADRLTVPPLFSS